MFVKNIKDCKEFTAGDNCKIREIFNAKTNKKLKLRYSLAYVVVKPKQTTAKHLLKTSEVYYILEGSGLMTIGKSKRKVKKGDTVYIPPKSIQCIKNTGKKKLEFLCIVDPAWRKEDEMVLNK